MKYTADEVLQYVREEDVKFIRLAFCDIYGHQKNVAIMPYELKNAFQYGIGIDASAVAGLGGNVRSDVFLRPDPSTLGRLPWRPESASVVRMFCDIFSTDGKPLNSDTRSLLKKAIADAAAKGITFQFGAEMEFYLFKTDEEGEPTKIPHDKAGYMDIAPEDKGENVRREIQLTLEKMGIQPESSHHEEGPGQNEIDFRYSEPLSAADNCITLLAVIRTIAASCGLYADFTPKPLPGEPGNGMHINISAASEDGRDVLYPMIAGIMKHIYDITAFLNPTENSYDRLGGSKAPGYITWSKENRSQLIRVPAAPSGRFRAEVRSADATANPYLAYALLIYAALEGITENIELPPSTDMNLYTASDEELTKLRHLPYSLSEAKHAAARSEFVRRYVPEELLKNYCHIDEA